MPTYRLVAKVDPQPGKAFVVRAPAVGVVDGVPDQGVYLNPSQAFLSLGVLNRRYLVQLPRDVQGVVTELLVDNTATAVGYGQPLFRLSQARELSAKGSWREDRAAEEREADDLIAVPSPSDGVFYRKPGPDSPVYVEEGSPVSTGTVLGLVEVMKCFNQIAYGGAGLPERGTVARILAEDSSEVSFGQTLFLVRPS